MGRTSALDSQLAVIAPRHGVCGKEKAKEPHTHHKAQRIQFQPKEQIP
jgi:hypothetical protein